MYFYTLLSSVVVSSGSNGTCPTAIWEISRSNPSTAAMFTSGAVQQHTPYFTSSMRGWGCGEQTKKLNIKFYAMSEYKRFTIFTKFLGFVARLRSAIKIWGIAQRGIRSYGGLSARVRFLPNFQRPRAAKLYVRSQSVLEVKNSTDLLYHHSDMLDGVGSLRADGGAGRKSSTFCFFLICTCYLWPCLGSPLIAMQWIMYFRFCGWRHVFK